MTYETAIDHIRKHMGPLYARAIQEGQGKEYPFHEGELVIGEVDGGSIPDNHIYIIVKRSPKGLCCGQKVGVLITKL